MLYHIQNLKKEFNGRTVLDIPELSIEKGMIYALLGPNGSGKTTLIHILSFLMPQSSGILFFQDAPVVFSSEKQLHALRRRVVLVEQHPILFTASVYKNIEFGLKMRKVPKPQRPAIIEEALDRVGMKDFIHAQAHRLSGGETQRVAIARALACSPEVILLDEPNANVDIENQIVIEKIIRDIHARKQTSVILCTHDTALASKLAHEKIFLFQGRLGNGFLENIFSGRIVAENGQNFCRINETVSFPTGSLKPGNVKVIFDPKSIQFPAIPGNASAPIVSFKSRVTQIAEEKQWIRLVLDTGVPLVGMIPKSLYQTINLQIGQEIHAEWPESGVQIIAALPEFSPGR